MDFIERIKDKLINRVVECCPHCNSRNIVKFGKINGKTQRYKCKNCLGTFSQFTKTPLSYSKKPIENWAIYIAALSNQKTLKVSSKLSGICLTTSFYWRHKLLSSLKIQGELEEFSNEIQIKEFVMAKSNKGNHKNKDIVWRRHRWLKSLCMPMVKLISCVDTEENRGMFPIDDIITGVQIKKYVLPKIKEGSTISTRRHKLYSPCAKEKSIKVKQFVLYNKGVMEKDFASFQELCFKLFLKPFRGVSTKYLTFYSNWFIWMEKEKYGQYLSLADKIMKGMNKLKVYEFPRVNLRGEICPA